MVGDAHTTMEDGSLVFSWQLEMFSIPLYLTSSIHKSLQKLWSCEVLKSLYYPFLRPEGCWQEGWGLSRAVSALRHCKEESPVSLYKVNKISTELGEERSKECHDLNFPFLNKSKWVVLVGLLIFFRRRMWRVRDDLWVVGKLPSLIWLGWFFILSVVFLHVSLSRGKDVAPESLKHNCFKQWASCCYSDLVQ